MVAHPVTRGKAWTGMSRMPVADRAGVPQSRRGACNFLLEWPYFAS